MKILPEVPKAASAYDLLSTQAQAASERLDDFHSTLNPLDARAWRVAYDLKVEAHMRAWAAGEKFKMEHHLAKTILSMT